MGQNPGVLPPAQWLFQDTTLATQAAWSDTAALESQLGRRALGGLLYVCVCVLQFHQ